MMINPRKIKVGQVRQCVDGIHKPLYVILSYSPSTGEFHVELLDGNDKGCRFMWGKRFVGKDVVIM